MSAIVRAGQPARTGHFAGGALVHPFWVVTSARRVAGLLPREIEVINDAHELTPARRNPQAGRGNHRPPRLQSGDARLRHRPAAPDPAGIDRDRPATGDRRPGAGHPRHRGDRSGLGQPGGRRRFGPAEPAQAGGAAGRSRRGECPQGLCRHPDRQHARRRLSQGTEQPLPRRRGWPADRALAHRSRLDAGRHHQLRRRLRPARSAVDLHPCGKLPRLHHRPHPPALRGLGTGERPPSAKRGIPMATAWAISRTSAPRPPSTGRWPATASSFPTRGWRTSPS